MPILIALLIALTGFNVAADVRFITETENTADYEKYEIPPEALEDAQIAAIIPAAPPPITVSCLFILDLPENAEAIPDVLQLVEGRGDVRSLLVRGGKDQCVEHTHRRRERVHE